MGSDGILRVRTAVLGLFRVLFLSLGLAIASPLHPVHPYDVHHENPDDAPEAEGGALWVLYVVSMVLVLLGGAFAGLTIALMGQDEIYLQVISLDSEEPQRRNAKRVFDLLKKGKHWVLVTLLLSNVIVNETLPVVLDRCFGGGVAAVVGSTVLIGMSSQPANLTTVLTYFACQSFSARSYPNPCAFAMVFRSVDICPSQFCF